MTNAEGIRFYQVNFGIRRVVLPRVLSLQQAAREAEPCRNHPYNR